MEWKKFENAVAAFMKALAPDARVVPDARQPDRHHKGPRQRDVFIEFKLGGHYPVLFLVSCKRWKRRLSSTDIEHFWGEYRNAGAHKGILYSYSGYYKPAVRKAKALGICCCSLYSNAPAELPEQLFFQSICTMSGFRLYIEGNVDSCWKTVGDLLRHRPIRDAGSVLDRLESIYLDGEKGALSQLDSVGLPPDWRVQVELTQPSGEKVTLILGQQWRFYTGRLEAHLIDGSYNFTSGDLKGSVATPSVDRMGPHPGPGWQLLEKRPSRLDRPVLNLILSKGDIRNGLLEAYGKLPVREVAVPKKRRLGPPVR